MKIKLLSFALAVLAAVALATTPGAMRSSVTLAWDPYPTNEISPELVIRIYSTTNLATPYTNWPFLVATSATNSSVTFALDAQQRWFIATASNYWGEGDFSNVASTPPLPRSDIRLHLGP